MARGEQILRHWNLLQTLQTRGVGLALRELADEFDVSERTIQRDFELLQEVGFPLDFQEDVSGKRFWRLPPDYLRSTPLMLGLTEALSLHLAERVFAPLAGTHLADGLATVLDKIRSLLPAAALDYFHELDDVIHVRRLGVTDYSGHAAHVRLLADAARAERSVRVTYNAIWRGDVYTTLFDPYGLVYYDGDLFVVGRSHRAQALRILKLTRITAAEETPEPFSRPPTFSLEAHFRDAFGIVPGRGDTVEIVVRFDGPSATLVEERVWHESQRLEWLPAEPTLFEGHPDDPAALLARFRLSNVLEFKRWLRAFGADAVVLQPAWLRDELRAELAEALQRYS